MYENVYFVLFFIIALTCIYRSTVQKKLPTLRRLPGLDYLEEAVNRSIEMGGSVHYTSGQSLLNNIGAVGGIVASAGVLKHVSSIVAEKGGKLNVTVPGGDVLLLFESVTQEGFAIANKLETYDQQVDFHYGGGHPRSYTSLILGVLSREKVVSQLFIGAAYSETAMVLGAGAERNCYQIGGSTVFARLPLHVVTCNYTFIGEEVYAAGAYLSEDPMQLGVIHGEDISRLILLILLTLGSILGNLGIPLIQNLL